MKKLDLLKIIKEEIDIALSETTNVLVTNRLGKTTTMPFNSPEEKKTVDTLKADSGITHIETTAGQKIKEAELEEEQLDEMAKITEPIENAIGVAVNRIKAQFPEITPEDITKIITSKKKQGEFAPELKAALDKDEEMHGGDEKYTAGLGGPQALGAVKKAFGGFEVGQRGRKANPETSTKPAASTPKSSPVSSDMTDEEGNAIEIDTTVKPVTGNADIEAELKRVISSKKSKLATAKGADYDRELAALKQFLTKPEISKYIKKKTVDGVNPYSIDSILKN
jgi:hypothetical protein